MNRLIKLYADKKVTFVEALENLEAEPHTWSKGLDYELIEKKDYFTLASNEGSVNYVNEWKQEVLNNFRPIYQQSNDTDK